MDITREKGTPEAIITDKKQLVAYFAAGAVPRDSWKIGLEAELFAVDRETLKSVPYQGDRGIAAILQEMSDRFGWTPSYEQGALLGLKKDSCRITLEPGGQIELSGSPCVFIADCLQERENFLADLKEVVEPKGLGLMAIGYQPVSTLADTEWIPKQRYRIMSQYFAQHGGKLAHHMMKLTTTIQVSIDYENEADFSEKMVLATYLTPVMQAIYADSPFKQGDFSGYLDFRGLCWEQTDLRRSGLFKQALEGSYTFDDYVEYLLGMPMIVRFDGEQAVPMHGLPFREYMRAGQATMADWDSHASFAFPEVRLRNYLELRMCDAVHSKLVPTVPAVIKGLFYEAGTRRKLKDYFRDYTASEITALYRQVHREGLKARVKGRPVLELARDIVSLAEEGLKELAREGKISDWEEVKYLEPLQEQLWEKGCSPAEELLVLWDKKGRDLFRLQDRLLL